MMEWCRSRSAMLTMSSSVRCTTMGEALHREIWHDWGRRCKNLYVPITYFVKKWLNSCPPRRVHICCLIPVSLGIGCGVQTARATALALAEVWTRRRPCGSRNQAHGRTGQRRGLARRTGSTARGRRSGGYPGAPISRCFAAGAVSGGSSGSASPTCASCAWANACAVVPCWRASRCRCPQR